MRTVCLILLAAISLKLCGAEPAPDAARVADWIARLGDADFVARKTAEEELAKAGASAQKGLENAAKSEDAEVRERAERLLSRVRVAQVLKKWDEAPPLAHSVEADFTMGEKDWHGTGHFKMLARDGKHSIGEIVFKMADGTSEMKLKAVEDGTFLWNERDDGATIRVLKYSVNSTEDHMKDRDFLERPADCANLEELRKRFAFIACRDGTLDGAEVYILDGERSAGADVAIPALKDSVKYARICVDKRAQFVRKVEMYDARHEMEFRLEYSKVKLGQKFEKSEFTYTPPAGVEVEDMDEALRKQKQVDLDRKAMREDVAPQKRLDDVEAAVVKKKLDKELAKAPAQTSRVPKAPDVPSVESTLKAVKELDLGLDKGK